MISEFLKGEPFNDNPMFQWDGEFLILFLHMFGSEPFEDPSRPNNILIVLAFLEALA